MIILLDVDGVLADTLAHAGVDASAMPSWESAPQALYEAFAAPGFVRSLPPCPCAVEGVAALRAAGAHPVFLTAPWYSSPTWASCRFRWLARHFGATHNDVIHTHAKHLVRGGMFIDDRPSNVEQWLAAHPDGIGLVWAQPYNRATRLPRVSSWDEVMRTLLVGEHIG